MLIYNVTIKVDWRIHEAWTAWMQETHIPEMMGTGCFENYQLVRILDTDESDGPTYAVQYYVADRGHYDHYLECYAPAIREKGWALWGDKMLAFRTLMQVVH